MSKKIEYTDKGYSYIKFVPEDCFKWGGGCICDSCGESMEKEDNIYLVWVLHGALCESCFKEWCNRSIRYEDDIQMQKECDTKYYKAYCQAINEKIVGEL